MDEYRHLIFMCKKIKILPFYGKKRLKIWISVCSLWIYSGSRKLRVKMAHFKNYSSFIEQRCAFVLIIMVVGKIN